MKKKNIDKLSPKGALEYTDELLVNLQKYLKEQEPDVRDFLALLVDAMDEMDQDDAFGTEGWRHSVMGE